METRVLYVMCPQFKISKEFFFRDGWIRDLQSGPGTKILIFTETGTKILILPGPGLGLKF